MCGITGFIGEGDKETLEKMTAVLRHRGPDDSGIFFDEQKKIGFGHTRLSILDVSLAGHQPMWSSDNQIVVVYNGEIYNFTELRRKIERYQNFQYKSASDTEVIIYAYKIFNEECFEKMEGMFAIAIYDFSKRKLILARDRVGKKPLYWTKSDGTLIFGSELKSLIIHPLFKRELDIESVNKYLQFDYTPTPHTIWKSVFKLEPACYVVFKDGNIRTEKYWQPRFEEISITFSKAEECLDNMIGEAVRNRLVSDVPVGVFLSGGLDSSAIAYYAKQNSKDQIKTFSIGFSEKSFDESYYARKVAKYLGTEHHEKIFSGEDSLNVISKVLNNLDEPIADASIIPTYLLAKFAREYVKVALGGDGGDELFAGYPTFQAEKFSSIYKAIPGFLRSGFIEPIINSVPSSQGYFSLDYKLKKFIEGFSVSDMYRHQVWLGSFDRNMRKRIFCREIWNDLEKVNVFDNIDQIYNEIGREKNKQEIGLNELLYQYERSYLMDEVMVKVDRATMLASLESRSPLLDYRIVDFVHSLPASFKLHGFTTKYIFKKLMENKLPSEIVWRSKKGFSMPISVWFRGPLRGMLEDVLSKKSVEKMGIFDYTFIEELKNDHYSNKKDNRKLLWNLFVLGVWWKNFNNT